MPSKDIPPFFAKRKLTRKEARKITKEVMSIGLKHWEARVMLAVVKAMEVTCDG